MVRVTPRFAACLPSLTDVAFLMPIVFLFGRLDGARTLLMDGDTGWHVRTGEWILRHGTVPRQDLFSFTHPGETWFAWEWGSDVIMAALHGWGMAAVVFAAVIVLSCTFALLYRLVRDCCGNPLLAIGLTGVAVAGSSIHWLARPHLATLLFTVLFLRILETGDSRRLWRVVPLTVLWTNLHAGFLFGIALIVLYALQDRRTVRPRLGAALASLGASLVNPYGWRLHAHIARYLAHDSWQFDHIHEFLSPNFHAPLALCFELMLGLSVAAGVWHLRRGRPHYLAVAAATAHMALVSARNIPLFLVVAAAPVALAAAEWLKWGARPSARTSLSAFLRLSSDIGAIERVTRVPAAAAVVSALLAALLFAPAASGKLRSEFDRRAFPARAIEQVRAPNVRVFTSDQWGDYLIYRLYPEIQVFVDGRSDFYGAAHEQLCQDVWNVRYDWEQKLARFGVNTLLLPAQTPLAGAVKESAHWQVEYDDGVAIVFRARGTQPVSGFGGQPPAGETAVTLRSERK
jgi:hypothetical protein